MKTILILGAVIVSLVLTACESDEYGREGRAPVVGAASGLNQSPHAGNSDGSRTDLR